MEITNYNYILGGFGVIIAISFVFFFKKVRQMFLNIFDGHFDKAELAGLTCLILLVYMVIKEGNRVQEWHLYNDLYIISVTAGAMSGMGLKAVLKHIASMKGVSSTETEEVKKITTVTKKTDNAGQGESLP